MIAASLGRLGLWRLAAMGLAVGFLLAVTSVVPAVEFGRYTLVLTFVQLMSALFLAWPNPAFVRIGREEYASTGRIGRALGARLLIQILLLVLAAFAVALVAVHVGPAVGMSPAVFAGVAVLLLITLSSAELVAAAGQSMMQFDGFALPSLLPRMALLLALLLMSAGTDRTAVVLMLLLAGGYGLAAAWSFARLPVATWRPCVVAAAPVRAILGTGWAMPLVTAFAFLIAAMDVWLLKLMVGDDAAGIYGWAYNVNLLAIAMLAPVSAVLAPVAVDGLRGAGPVSMDRYLNVTDGFGALIGALLPLGIAFLGVLGDSLPLGEYRSAVMPALLLGVGIVFQFGMACLEPVIFISASQVPKAALVAAGMALINFLLDIALIPRIGVAGPAWATVAAFAFGMLCYRQLASAPAGLTPRRPFFTIFCGAITLLLAAANGWFDVAQMLLLGISASLMLIIFGRRCGVFNGLCEASLEPIQRLGCWLASPGSQILPSEG
jgi:O-antigen/teichoic acid export membrane protein